MASGVSAARAAEEPPAPEPPAEQKPPPAPPAPAQEEFSFLPLVHDIIKCWRAVTREDRIPHRHTSLETGEL